MVTVFASPDDLLGAVGEHLGHSDWVTVDQPRIDMFAEATGEGGAKPACVVESVSRFLR